MKPWELLAIALASFGGGQQGEGGYVHYVSPTKRYADQHQKAKHNRRKKPNKHMRNLYKLGR